ncbi:MAG: hypothetical protein KAI57_03635 [Candidatus Pacebacteria bacterium]|nr:hypothetical protein [Candidatus Paceibacterota bacterium]
MKNRKKFVMILFVVLTSSSFSGCSIRSVENGDVENKTEEGIKEEIKQEGIKTIDTDNDGLTNREERDLGTDINKIDTDSDGLTDFEEAMKYKTNPLKNDSDNDGYSDGQEIEGGYNPLGDGQLDIDNDGIGDADEKKYGTDPEKRDTDGDGLYDKEEIDLGRDPLKIEIKNS